MVNKALIIVTDEYDGLTGGFERIKAEKLINDLRGKGWTVNNDGSIIVADKDQFIGLRNWLRDHNNDPDDRFFIYIADQVQLGPVSIQFNAGTEDVTLAIDEKFKEHSFQEFTLVYVGPHSGRAIHDQVHLGPKCLLICSMDENENFVDDQFDLQCSLIGEDFKEAAKSEREKLKHEHPPQSVIIRENNSPVY